MRVHPALVAFVGLLAAGCGGSKLNQSFGAGQFSEVARIFEADSALHAREGALYRAGVAYALPESSAYDPAAALEVFHRLLLLYPNSSHRGRVVQLQQLLAEVQLRASRELRRAEELATLATRLEIQRRELDELREQLVTEQTRSTALRAIVDQLNREVRARDGEIRALQEELGALKEIDLSRPFPSQPEIPPPDPSGSR